jgi:hypothetical protein
VGTGGVTRKRRGRKSEGGGKTYYVAESCDWASLNCNPQAKLADACADVLTISSWIFRSVASGRMDNRSMYQFRLLVFLKLLLSND